MYSIQEFVVGISITDVLEDALPDSFQNSIVLDNRVYDLKAIIDRHYGLNTNNITKETLNHTGSKRKVDLFFEYLEDRQQIEYPATNWKFYSANLNEYMVDDKLLTNGKIFSDDKCITNKLHFLTSEEDIDYSYIGHRYEFGLSRETGYNYLDIFSSYFQNFANDVFISIKLRKV